jgi:hypothetical protein
LTDRRRRWTTPSSPCGREPAARQAEPLKLLVHGQCPEGRADAAVVLEIDGKEYEAGSVGMAGRCASAIGTRYSGTLISYRIDTVTPASRKRSLHHDQVGSQEYRGAVSPPTSSRPASAPLVALNRATIASWAPARQRTDRRCWGVTGIDAETQTQIRKRGRDGL